MTTAVSCSTAWCRTHEPVGDNGEPTHTSDTLTVTLVDGEDAHLPEPGQLDLLRAELFWDECFASGSVWIASGRADELVLDRAQGEKLADRLEIYARQLRDLCKHLPASDDAHGEPVDVADAAFSACLDAIEVALKASTNLPRTRTALRNAVDLYADEVRG